MAVIITVMVLELKVPSAGAMSDRAALLANARIFAVYLLSFVQVGIYWVNHHYLMDDLETVTHGILWANLGLLFCLSLLPFGLEWIGTRGVNPAPVAIYAVCFSLPTLAWSVLAYLVRCRTQIPPAAGPWKQATSAMLSVSAVFVAFRSPWTALAMMALTGLLWLFAPRRIAEKTRALQEARSPVARSS